MSSYRTLISRSVETWDRVLFSNARGYIMKQSMRKSSTSNNRKSHQSLHKKNYAKNSIPARQRRIDINDGLVLGSEQIKSIWKSYGSSGDAANNTFDLKEVLLQYPHINPHLLKEIENNSQMKETHQTCDGGIEFVQEDVEPSKFEFPDTNVAVKAEDQLQRMLSKVKAQENIPSAMKSEIRDILMEEFETVIDLWLSIADENMDMVGKETESFDFKMEQESLAALFRASRLVLEFESKFIIELRKSVEYEEETELILSAPHTTNYQKIISTFYNVFRKRKGTMAESRVEAIQSQCAKLLEKMMKHIISRRMDSLNDEIDQSNEQHHVEQRGQYTLSESFMQLISFYTRSDHDSNYTTAVEKATMASKLLKEMELYFHDFYTVPSPSRDNQQFLLSINPPNEIFNSVICFYSSIAIKQKCGSCAMKSVEILNRMNKRYQAYVEKSDEQNNSDILFAQPNLSSYKAVLEAFCSLKQIDQQPIQELEELMASANGDDNVRNDASLQILIEECRSKFN